MNNLTSEFEKESKKENENEKENKNNNQYLFVSCNEKIKSYTGNKKSFFGKGNIKNPDALNEIQLNNENSLWNDGIIAVEMEIELAALENKKIILTMGVGNSIIECQDIAYKYSNIGNVYEEYEKTKKYWKEKTEIILDILTNH